MGSEGTLEAVPGHTLNSPAPSRPARARAVNPNAASSGGAIIAPALRERKVKIEMLTSTPGKNGEQWDTVSSPRLNPDCPHQIRPKRAPSLVRQECTGAEAEKGAK